MPDLPETNTVTVLRQKTGYKELDELLDRCAKLGVPIKDGEWTVQDFEELVKAANEAVRRLQSVEGRDLAPADIPIIISECRKTMSPSVWFALRYARYDYRKAGQPD